MPLFCLSFFALCLSLILTTWIAPSPTPSSGGWSLSPSSPRRSASRKRDGGGGLVWIPISPPPLLDPPPASPQRFVIILVERVRDPFCSLEKPWRGSEPCWVPAPPVPPTPPPPPRGPSYRSPFTHWGSITGSVFLQGRQRTSDLWILCHPLFLVGPGGRGGPAPLVIFHFRQPNFVRVFAPDNKKTRIMCGGVLCT